MDRTEPPSTRTRIQTVALELFIEQGYERTSLREIAERLGLTKAALYYHFRSKDEIVSSMIIDRTTQIDALIAWAKTEPRSVETRREFLRRYAIDLHQSSHHQVMRFFERNQTAVGSLAKGQELRDRLRTIGEVLCEPGASLKEQLKVSLAIFALHAAWIVIRDPEVTDEQRRAAAIEVALELIDD